MSPRIKSATGRAASSAQPGKTVQLKDVSKTACLGKRPASASSIACWAADCGGQRGAGRGEPGIGKSTLFLQMANKLAEKHRVLYISGEESAEQVGMRAERLGLSCPMQFLAETNLSVILANSRAGAADYLIIDSIQTIYHEDITSAAGSVSQVRECAAALARMAKSTGIALFIVGHVTKDGNIAGPRCLEHLVDTVLYFEGERASSFRILRAVKNRFGSTNEIGVFDMGNLGMTEVQNPRPSCWKAGRRIWRALCIYCALEGRALCFWK